MRDYSQVLYQNGVWESIRWLSLTFKWELGGWPGVVSGAISELCKHRNHFELVALSIMWCKINLINNTHSKTHLDVWEINYIFWILICESKLRALFFPYDIVCAYLKVWIGKNWVFLRAYHSLRSYHTDDSKNVKSNVMFFS